MEFLVEKMEISQLRDLQSQRLVNLVNYLSKSSNFYQEKFKALGMSVEDINSISDITKLPITYKQDLRNNYPFGLFTVPKEELQRIHCSSGTTGKPTVVGYTKEDVELFSEVVARSLNAAGAQPGMLLHNAYGYGIFTGGLGVHYTKNFIIYDYTNPIFLCLKNPPQDFSQSGLLKKRKSKLNLLHHRL